jgi:hypothetical protein
MARGDLLENITSSDRETENSNNFVVEDYYVSSSEQLKVGNEAPLRHVRAMSYMH